MSDFNIGSERWPGLSKLVEECGEVIQVVGKLMATGGEVEHWDGTNLKERLEEEMGDVLGALEFVMQANPFLDGGKIKWRSEQKLELFHKWHEEECAKDVGGKPVDNLEDARAIAQSHGFHVGPPAYPQPWSVKKQELEAEIKRLTKLNAKHAATINDMIQYVPLDNELLQKIIHTDIPPATTIPSSPRPPPGNIPATDVAPGQGVCRFCGSAASCTTGTICRNCSGVEYGDG